MCLKSDYELCHKGNFVFIERPYVFNTMDEMDEYVADFFEQ